MTVGTGPEPTTRVRRVGVGIVELVPEEPAGSGAMATLRANTHHHVCMLLLAILFAAQSADVVTTYSALSGRYIEENPLFRALLQRWPVAAFTAKLAVVAAIALLVLTRLRGRRAAAALAVAAAVSVTAPVLNFLLIVRG